MRSKKKTYGLLAVFVVLLVLAVLFLFDSPIATEDDSSEATEEDVLLISNQNELIMAFVEKDPDITINVTELNKIEVKALVEKYPAVYGNLPEKTLYSVIYEKDGNGYNCIVDVEKKETLTCIKTLAIGMNIG